MAACHRHYALDNDRSTARRMLDNLARMLDPASQERLTRSRSLDGGRVRFGGARVWEVAAGTGSMARWMADQGAHVVATDIKPQHISPHPRVSIMPHDVVTDPTPAGGDFDMIHARCALAHWPAREGVLGRLAGALKPGGALITEEWGPQPGRILVSPVADAVGVYGRYQLALLEVVRSRGNDTEWALRVPAVMREAGLIGVDVRLVAESWGGGSAGCLLPLAVAEGLRGQLIATGVVSAGDLDRLPEIMTDPDTLLVANVCFSTIGYRPV